jgi:hypothetical protein
VFRFWLRKLFPSFVRLESQRRRWLVHPRTRLRLEVLEDRAVPTTYLVNTTNDVLNDVTGTELTLRDAITAISTLAPSGNAPAGQASGNTIQFAIGSAGSSQTIALGSALPSIDHSATIDSFSQGGAGYSGPPLIELNGASAGATAVGLKLTSANDVVDGLVINRFGGDGILVTGATATGVLIQGDFIGTDAAGTAINSGTTSFGNGGAGVRVKSGATATIGGDPTKAAERNVIGGNAVGIAPESDGSTVVGDFIGTDPAGDNLGNTGDGVKVSGGGNRIGTTSTGTVQRDVISANGGHGIEVTGTSATNNLIDGNYVGLAPDGSTALGNTDNGIDVNAGSTGTLIGTVAFNVISSNGGVGIDVVGNGTTARSVDNRIGTDATKSGADLHNKGGKAIAIGAGATLEATSAASDNVNGLVDNAGTLAPGASPGIFDVTDYTQEATGTLQIEVQGVTTAGTDFDQLDVSGTATLGGTLKVVLLNNFVPPFARTVPFLTAGSFAAPNNRFATVDLSGASNADGVPLFGVTYAASGVSLRSAIIVNSTNDPNSGASGETTLRDAITTANLDAALDYVYFDVPTSDAHFDAVTKRWTIPLESALPDVTRPVVIDGTTQPGTAATPRIIVDGSNVSGSKDGLTLASGSDGSTVTGLQIQNFAKGSGVTIASSNDVIGTGDVLTGNGTAGVSVASSGTGDTITADSIFANGPSNAGPGIVLAAGANHDQPAPVLTDVALTSTTQLSVSGSLTLSSAPNERFTVEFFASPAGDPEGKTFVGSLPETTNGSGVVSFDNVPLTSPVALTGPIITATATRVSTGDTSAFSSAIDLLEVTNTNDTGAGSLRQAITNADFLTGPQTITFAIPGAGPHTISPATPLPSVTAAATIDGTSQPGFPGTSSVVLDGSGAGANADGLTLAADGGAVKGLQIQNFSRDGVRITSSNDVGGGSVANADVISGNGGAGVHVVSGTGDTISSDSIFANGSTSTGPGIVLDSGANHDQVAPMLTGVTVTRANQITVSGTLSRVANEDYTIELFASPAGDPEGKTFLGSLNLSRRSPASFTSGTLTSAALTSTSIITATATALTVHPGDTSAFSAPAGLFVVTNTNDSGVGSLRQAIENANTFGSATITFAIPGRGTHTITLSSAPLDSLNKATTIDGTSQPGYAGTPLIEVTGTGAGASGDGLDVGTNAGGSAIEGLSIYGFSGNGVVLGGSTGSTLTASYVGVKADGTIAPNGRNGGDGVMVTTANNVVGTAMGAGNVISGNTQNGVEVTGAAATGNTIQGNKIGTDAAGTADRGNGGDGVRISANGNVVGAANTIAFDATAGVHVVSGTGDTISSDSIFANGSTSTGPGIVLDSGANHDQPAPVLNGVILTSTTQLTVTGTLTAPNDGAYTVEVFASPAGDPEGKTFIGSLSVNVVGGTATLPDTLLTSPTALTATSILTATATRGATGDTSAFSSAIGLFVVTNTNDLGGGSFRQALANANTIGNATVTFAIPAARLQPIAPASALPALTKATTIDGTSQPGYAGTPVIQIDGSGAGAGVDGLTVSATGGGSVIKGLSIYGFTGNGVVLGGSTGSTLTASYVGVKADGTIASADGGDGVKITSAGNTVGGTAMGAGNVISGNTQNGIEVTGAATGNTIQGNKIGTDKTGTTAVANTLDGIDVNTGASATIGGTMTGAPNLISGNKRDGVRLDTAGSGNSVLGNAALGNTGDGIDVINTVGVTIGGTAFGAGNVISGNGAHGVEIAGAASTGVTVQGNDVGTDKTGTMKLSNTLDGIDVNSGAASNTIGGSSAGNVISGNKRDGVRFQGAGLANKVQGNLIGLDANGSTMVANGGDGVNVIDTNTVTIGGSSAGLGNTISGNTLNGVEIAGTSTNNQVEEDLIGTTSTGAAGPGNGADGVLVSASGNKISDPNVISGNAGAGVEITGASNVVAGNLIGTVKANGTDGVFVHGLATATNNTIGGTTMAERNVISGNTRDGVRIDTAGTGNVVEGNFIGTNTAGTAALANGGDGVHVLATSSVTIGTPSAGNVISGNTLNGVEIVSGSTGVMVQGNKIGTNAAGGVPAVANKGDGVLIDGASGNAVGGTVAGAGNVISGNVGDGVVVSDKTGAANKNVIRGNKIGTVAANPIGVLVSGTIATNGVSGTIIGGDDAADGTTDGNVMARNVISGNTGDGVQVTGTSAVGTVIAGNFVGLSTAGTGPLGNGGNGVLVTGGAQTTTVGGGTALAGNVISGNTGDGVRLDGAAGTNRVQGNKIGTNAAGTSIAGGLGNTGDGVRVTGTTTGAFVGTDGDGTNDATEGNVIGGNAVGVALETSGNAVAGNLIGTNSAGDNLGNLGDGVLISAAGNRVGTDANGISDALEGNVISGNKKHGVEISGASDNGEVIAGNRIGTDKSGTTKLGNTGDGVLISSAGATTGTMIVVGGHSDVERNVISGNKRDGVRLASAGAVAVVEGNFVGTDATGLVGLGNTFDGIDVMNVASALISSNLVSGNQQHGIDLSGAVTTDVLANLIGLASTGAIAVPNSFDGVELQAGANNNHVGDGTAAHRNVISGNGRDGVRLSGAGTNNSIDDDLIGTNTTGTAVVSGMVTFGNGGDGVNVINSAMTEVRGNVISGNKMHGVELSGPGTTNAAVAGNMIGTDVNGSIALGNKVDGIDVNAAAATAAIGGTTAADRDVISGNGRDGVRLDGAGGGDVVEGDFVGTDASGTAPLGNGGDGVKVLGSGAVMIGGLTAGGNLVAHNAGNGVEVTGAGSAGTVVAGNDVVANVMDGVNVGEVVHVLVQSNTINGNLRHGVFIHGAQRVVVGDDVTAADLNPAAGFVPPGAGAGNMIDNNAGAGVAVVDEAGQPDATGNAIRHDVLQNNGGPGIDLGDDGPTLNHPGFRTSGPNDQQNYPVLTQLSSFSGFTVLRGSFVGAPMTAYVLDLYADASANADSSLGQFSITTNASGTAILQQVFQSNGFAQGATVTLTATDGAGNTSELSPAVQVSNNSIVISQPQAYFAVGAGAGGQGIVKVFDSTNNQELVTLMPFPGFMGGLRVAKGDVNGDGIDDLVVAAGPGGNSHVKVYDGATLSSNPRELMSFLAFPGFQGGTYVAVGDVNGDGHGDIIVGAGMGGHSHVKVFDGSSPGTPRELSSFFAFMAYDGEVRVGAGDFFGDGHSEVIVAASSVPHVRVIDVEHGNRYLFNHLLTGFDSSLAGFLGGLYVSAADLNGDGFDDLIVSTGSNLNAPGSAVVGPRVYVFNGANFQMGSQFFAYDPTFQGGVRVGVADRDGTGLPSIVTGPEMGAGPDVRFQHVDAGTFAHLNEMDAFLALDASQRFGVYVA